MRAVLLLANHCSVKNGGGEKHIFSYLNYVDSVLVASMLPLVVVLIEEVYTHSSGFRLDNLLLY